MLDKVIKVNEDELVSSGFEIGDKVKIKGSNLSGEVTGINSNDQMIDVLHEDGTTKSYTVSQIVNSEDSEEEGKEENEKEGENTEKEQNAKNEKS